MTCSVQSVDCDRSGLLHTEIHSRQWYAAVYQLTCRRAKLLMRQTVEEEGQLANNHMPVPECNSKTPMRLSMGGVGVDALV